MTAEEGVDDMTTESNRASAVWGGRIAFAAIVLFVVGGVNAIQGLAAVLKDEVYLVTESGLLVTADFTVWGWTLLIWGVVMALAGAGLVSGGLVPLVRRRGRGGQPVRAVRLVPGLPALEPGGDRLNVAVLYALTVRWQEAQAGLGS